MDKYKWVYVMSCRKIFSMAFVFAIVLVAISCGPPPCSVQVYELEPIKVKIYMDNPDTLYYQHGVMLQYMNSDTSFVMDTIIVNDSTQVVSRMLVKDSCRLNISERIFNLLKGDTAGFGNPEAGGNYSWLKISCDRFDYKTKSVDLSVWKTRFVQDCSNWNEK